MIVFLRPLGLRLCLNCDAATSILILLKIEDMIDRSLENLSAVLEGDELPNDDPPLLFKSTSNGFSS